MSKEVRLIDANALSRNIEADHIVAKAMYKGIDIPLDATFGVIDYDIKTAPTIDPVKHGHWIPINRESGRCSACGEDDDYPLMCCEGTPSTRFEPHPYCPWCGAKMDEVIE